MNQVVFLTTAVLLLSFCVADDVQTSHYDVQVKGAFGVNTTTAKVKLDKSKMTVHVEVASDSSSRPTFAGGLSFYDVKKNFIALQPDPLKDRCLLHIPAAEFKIKDAELLLKQPANNGLLPYQKCIYKDYVPSDYDQNIQDAAVTECSVKNFTGVIQDCQPASPNGGVNFCLMTPVLTSADGPFLGCLVGIRS